MQSFVVIFNLKFSMVNSNSKLNECESECKFEPESAPANLNLNSVSSVSVPGKKIDS